MRLVLDTNVVVSAVLGASAPTRLIEMAAEGEIELLSSIELLAELSEVLARDHTLRGGSRASGDPRPRCLRTTKRSPIR